MSLKFKLVQRKDFSQDAADDDKLFYAQIVSNGVVSFDELCDDVAEESALSSADVKATMDRIVRKVKQHLRNGRTVSLGELGTLRLSIGSKGAETAKSFDANTMMKKPNIIYTPPKKLKEACQDVTYTRVGSLPEDDDSEEEAVPHP